MEEVEEKHDMPVNGKVVADAVKKIIAQGPGSISRIMDEEVFPFIKDVETLATSMANLYQEHAAHFIILGVKVNIAVEVMDNEAFRSQVGANMFDDNDINRVRKHDDAASPVQ